MTCATSPGVRAIMKMPLNAAGFIPRSARMAPMAPSTLIGQRFLGVGERFFNGPRRFHVRAIHAGFARQFEQPRRARILGVIAMTKSRHALARFLHRRERARGGFIHRNGFTRGAIGDCFQLSGAIFNGAAVMTIDRHDAGGDRRAQRRAGRCDGSRGQRTRRRRAMIDRRHQNRVHQTRDGGDGNSPVKIK